MIDLSTPAKRAKLQPKGNGPHWKEPYYVSVAGPRGGVSLGWRPGAWIGRVSIDGKPVPEKIADADDPGVRGGISYKEAVELTLAWAKGKRANAVVQADAEEAEAKRVPTVGTALDAYIVSQYRKTDQRSAKATEQRLRKHVDERFAKLGLDRLKAKHIEDWRSRLQGLKPTSQNRLLNAVRAALNEAIIRHRGILPASIAMEVKVGTQRLSIEAGDRARSNVILTAAQVRKLIDAAYAEGDDLGHLILLASCTGARYGQLTAIRVGDLLEHRVMVPGARKGRSAKPRPPVAIELAPDMRAKLDAALYGRNDPDGILLLRWYFKKGSNGVRWERSHRAPWGPAIDIDQPWLKIAKAAGLPVGVSMYSLRHTSIVRALRLNMPVRMVAQWHDTSTEMIERHYGMHISDASRDLGRRAALSFA